MKNSLWLESLFINKFLIFDKIIMLPDNFPSFYCRSQCSLMDLHISNFLNHIFSFWFKDILKKISKLHFISLVLIWFNLQDVTWRHFLNLKFSIAQVSFTLKKNDFLENKSWTNSQSSIYFWFENQYYLRNLYQLLTVKPKILYSKVKVK